MNALVALVVAAVVFGCAGVLLLVWLARRKRVRCPRCEKRKGRFVAEFSYGFKIGYIGRHPFKHVPTTRVFKCEGCGHEWKETAG